LVATGKTAARTGAGRLVDMKTAVSRTNRVMKDFLVITGFVVFVAKVGKFSMVASSLKIGGLTTDFQEC
jgi:hypothetical protein